MLGILCGLESEAALARRIKDAQVICAAARPAKARALMRELICKGGKRFVSFGIAGGLKPGFAPGDLVIGTHIASDKGLWVCDAEWSAELAEKMPQVKRGAIWGSETLIATAKDKSRLHEQSSCVAVDMESQCMAEAAAEAGLPFVVVRAICDAANMNVPPAVMASIAEDGSVSLPCVLGSIARNPLQIPSLVHAGMGAGRGLRALEQVLQAF